MEIRLLLGVGLEADTVVGNIGGEVSCLNPTTMSCDIVDLLLQPRGRFLQMARERVLELPLRLFVIVADPLDARIQTFWVRRVELIDAAQSIGVTGEPLLPELLRVNPDSAAKRSAFSRSSLRNGSAKRG